MTKISEKNYNKNEKKILKTTTPSLPELSCNARDNNLKPINFEEITI